MVLPGMVVGPTVLMRKNIVNLDQVGVARGCKIGPGFRMGRREDFLEFLC